MMSSPNHPTSDIEDAFSSNFPDYFPASPGNTSSESSNNSSGLVPVASPTLSRFHNDPYMKTAPMAKSLASHISSKGKSQSGAIKIGASVRLYQKSQGGEKTSKRACMEREREEVVQEPEAKVKPSVKFSQGKSNSGQPKSTTERQNPK
ncbi:hypothetical protein Tco_0032026 [Tanacetum coccineum]